MYRYNYFYRKCLNTYTHPYVWVYIHIRGFHNLFLYLYRVKLHIYEDDCLFLHKTWHLLTSKLNYEFISNLSIYLKFFKLSFLFTYLYEKITDFINQFFFLFMATSTAYGSSWARGWIRTAAASLCHSHGNMGSKLHLQPMNTKSLNCWMRSGVEPISSWALCRVLNLPSHNRNSLD